MARSANRPWFVQTLLVAFSRRMCCSRVCSVRTKQRLPRRSTVWPAMRPGMRRTRFSRQAMMPRYGPPYCIGVPSVWPSATAMSAPQSPGRFKQAEADRIERGDDAAPGVVSDFGERGGVFDAAEEVRLLDDDAGGFMIDDGGEIVGPHDAAGRADGDDFDADVFEIRGDRLPVLGWTLAATTILCRGRWR